MGKRKGEFVFVDSLGNIDGDAWKNIRKVLLRFSKLLGIKIRVSNPHGYAHEPKTEEGTLFIRFWSTPVSTVGKKYEDLFGLKLEGSQRDGREPTGTGVPLRDPVSQEIFGEIHGGTLYILFDLPHVDVHSYKLMEQAMLQFVLVAAASEAVPKWLRNKKVAGIARRILSREEEDRRKVIIREYSGNHWIEFLDSLRLRLMKKFSLPVPVVILPTGCKDKTLDEDVLSLSLVYDHDRILEKPDEKILKKNHICCAYSSKGMWIEIWNLPSDPGDSDIKIILDILSKAIPLAVESDPAKRQERKDARKKAEREAMKKTWIEKIRGRLQRQKEEAMKVAIDMEGKIRDLQHKLTESIRSAEELRARAHFLDEEIERSKADEERYEREFVQLFELPHVTDIKFSDRTIEVFTDHLYCDDRGKRYDLGKYRMVIYMNGSEGGVRFFNLTRTVLGYWGKCHHPHVSDEGTACFGNIKEAIPELIAKSEYVILITLCLQFLQSVSVEDRAGQYITNWPVVETPEKGVVA